MAVVRVYSEQDALTITAFPMADDIGYVVRVGDRDHEGVYLGAVFHEGARWVAYAPTADGSTASFGSSVDLDELMTECFVTQVRISDDAGEG